jgi:NADH-quinone oxidoreductase subunit L
MTFVVTFVGFWIHLYATGYMAGDDGYARFFAEMNLFVAAMLILVLADNLLLLYLGWEGVGLCSYLLIGFWYKDAKNGAAARKAFIVTRIGDTALAIGLFLIFTHLGSLRFLEALHDAPIVWPVGSPLPLVAALLILGGAVGKSAQIPLQTWLPDAMAGPTPVSALIHAATMVTAGVYLIARTHVLFDLAPVARGVVAAVGAATLLVAGASALVQMDIKRVLAYSTISQIGYMFVALGVGAYSAAIFHLLTHAFFKALLFLAAGSVIVALDHEQDIRKMGGLRRALPTTYVTFLIGGAALAGFPLVTAGFYSKDWILAEAWASPAGGRILWAAGAIGAALTALYIFRLIFLVFHGETRTPVHHAPGARMTVPLLVLAVFSLGVGFLQLPPTLGDVPTFSRFLIRNGGGFDHSAEYAFRGLADIERGRLDHATEFALQGIAAAIAIAGIVVAYVLYVRRRAVPADSALRRFLFAGWGFDAVYDRLVVRPFLWTTRVLRSDPFDFIYAAAAAVTDTFHRLAAMTQTGRVRWYAAGIATGAVAVLAYMVLG